MEDYSPSIEGSLTAKKVKEKQKKKRKKR